MSMTDKELAAALLDQEHQALNAGWKLGGQASADAFCRARLFGAAIDFIERHTSDTRKVGAEMTGQENER